MIGRAIAGIIVMSACVSGLAAQAPEPRLDAYDAAVKSYASGGYLTAAVVPLQAFTRKHFDAAVERLVARKDHRFAEAAAMFQLEIGLGVVGLSSAAAAGHFDLGQKLLRSTQPRLHADATQDQLTFWATWYGVVGSAFLSVNDPPRARPWIEKALDLRPQSAPLLTLLGAAEELDAASWNPALWTTTSQKTRAMMQRNRGLASAAQNYRTALQSDPSYALAEIRLGRVQFLRRDLEEARATLERAQPRAEEPGHRYLAALFLGAVYQEQDNLAAARAAYERALASVPESQTAAVALGYVELITGRPDRAQALAQAFAATTADDRHWWAYKNGGLDEAGLAWLRERIRQ